MPMEDTEFYAQARSHKVTRSAISELLVAYDSIKHGYIVSIPYGLDHPYDLVLDKGGKLTRVKVKTLTANWQVQLGNLVLDSIDTLAVVDRVEQSVYYLPVAELSLGGTFYLRTDLRERYKST